MNVGDTPGKEKQAMTGWQEFAALGAGLSFGDLAPDVVECATRAFIDTVAVMIDGREEDAPARVRDALAPLFGADGACLLVGQDGRGVPEALALVHNGTLAHVLDYDDTHEHVTGHPSALLVPMILAVGESESASGAAMLTAYVVGLETLAALGRHMGREGYRKGWHYTSILGPVGCAAAAGSILGLSADATLVALSTAASVSHGLKANFGTMTKSFHVGWSALGGVASARLAARGFSSNPKAVLGDYGLARLIAGPASGDFVAPSFGEALVKTGLNMKVFPSCGQSHATLIAARRALFRLDEAQPGGWSADRITRVKVRLYPDYRRQLIYDWPSARLEGKFCLKYLLSAMLTDRGVTNATFTEAALEKLSASALRHRIEIVEDPSMDSSAAELEIVTADGLAISASTSPGDRAFAAEDAPAVLGRKFVDCTSSFYGEQGARDRLSRLERFATLDAAEIFSCLRATASDQR
jgi:2-methylcitrate dehydratase PrpD